MVNITHKNYSLRKAIASAVVKVSSDKTTSAIKNGTVPKGNVFDFARAAGLLAIKKTSDAIPDCHPLPIEYAAIHFVIHDQEIEITVEVHTIYKTGVEVEAMHGAAITALTLYDMLKPIDKGVEINAIKLVKKTGGKSDKHANPGEALNCCVVVCSDTLSQGKGEDRSGLLAVERLTQLGLTVVGHDVVADDYTAIQAKAQQCIADKIDLVVFVGGTGLSKRDLTPEALAPLIETPIPGIMEAFRHYGQLRMPHAMFSRGIAGFAQNTLLLTLPGATGAVQEAMDALFPHVLHLFTVRAGFRHDGLS